MTEKQEIAAKILQHSVELLKPLSTDVKGINHDWQKKFIGRVSSALGLVCLMDKMEHGNEIVTLEDLQGSYNSLKEYTIEYPQK